MSAPITEPRCVGFARHWEAGRGKQITPIAASWEEGEERKTNSFWMSSHGGPAAGAGLMLGTPLSLSLSLSLSVGHRLFCFSLCSISERPRPSLRCLRPSLSTLFQRWLFLSKFQKRQNSQNILYNFSNEFRVEMEFVNY